MVGRLVGVEPIATRSALRIELRVAPLSTTASIVCRGPQVPSPSRARQRSSTVGPTRGSYVSQMRGKR
jgi:hypothetical protein